MAVELETSNIFQYASAVTVALIGVAFGLQRLLKSWGVTAAETSVIQMLRGEIERMAAQNRLLLTELNKLQKEFVELHRSFSELTMENQQLRNEVELLIKQMRSPDEQT